MSWGMQPQAMIGHSVGEYVAACLAGVFSLEDALMLVAERGRLMQQMPRGDMLAVPLSEQEVQPYLGAQLSLAAVNGPSMCVVSGPSEAVADVQYTLAEEGVDCRPLHTSHAFHSAMMGQAAVSFARVIEGVKLNAPSIPYISNVTGTWIDASEATDPAYWARHLRQTVRFADGLATLCEDPDQALLEVGPGRTLATLARQHPGKGASQPVFSSIRHPQEQQPEEAFLQSTLGRLWVSGVERRLEQLYAGERRYRVALPTYPFERRRYFIDPPKRQPVAPRKQPQEQSQAAIEAVEQVEAPAQSEPQPAQLHPRPGLQQAYVAPVNELERSIAQMWQEALGIDQVGIHDDFFELGGHSLLATQLMSRLRDTFQVEVPMQVLFATPTVATLASAIAEKQLEQTDAQMLEQLLSEIKGLSEEELQLMLAGED